VSSGLKILVVDDSAFMRLLISDLISEDQELEVVGTATNGLDAAEKVSELSPDVVVLDLNMGKYDGLFAVKSIMKEKPTPILILSSVGNTNLDPIFEALKYGAVDYMNKPNRNNSKMRLMRSELITKVKSVSRAKPRTSVEDPSPRVSTEKTSHTSKFEIIVIGASTGGPSAIERVIRDLPQDFDIPIVICQHMPSSFISPFVNRLDSLTSLKVSLGTKSMSLLRGSITICPGVANMIVTEKRNEKTLDFTDEQFREYNNPSINAMMLSVAKVYGDKSVGVLLTGMGKDGVRGLKAIKDAGGFTIAQDEHSSIIYGMPKVAVENQAVSISLDVKNIGGHFVNKL